MHIFNIFSRTINKKQSTVGQRPVKRVVSRSADTFFQPFKQKAVSPINVNLKTAFRKRINLSVDTYERILAGSTGKTLGNLPKDVLSAIITAANGDRKTKSQKIKQIQSAFQKTAEILSSYTSIETDAYHDGSKLRTSNFEIVHQILQQVISLRAVDCSEKTAQLYSRAENLLKTAFQEIIPNNTKIKIQDVGNGYFGNVFKISFKDENGKNVFNDLAIKCFKSEAEIFDNYFARLQFAEKFGESLGDNELNKLILQLYPDLSKEHLIFYRRMVLQHNSQNTFMQQDFINDIHSMHNRHGAMAEANSTEFIRFFTGHKLQDKDDMILPDFFGFGKAPFCLSKFEEPSTKKTKPTKTVPMRALGIIHLDAAHDGNKVNGRIIDIGGVVNLEHPQTMNKNEIKQFKKNFRKNNA